MSNILVVEDEQVLAGLLKEILEREEYHVTAVLQGKDAVQFALRETPHLIVFDTVQADTANYQVIQSLRNHPKTMHIPIIVLSECDDSDQKVRAFDLGVDDYITKPFHSEELRARIRTQLRRVRQSFLSPLIDLPGGLQVERAIGYRLSSLDPWSILYLDLDNFKAFNDVYGFLTGNDMIRLVGKICRGMVRDYGNPDDFVGHVGGDDFVVLTTPDRSQSLCKRIIEHYKDESTSFYSADDLERGSIIGVDRKGRPYQFPLVSLSVGVICNQFRNSHSIREVSHLAAEAKCFAKQSTNNMYFYHLNSRRELACPVPAGASLKYTPVASARQDLLELVGEDVVGRYEARVH